MEMSSVKYGLFVWGEQGGRQAREKIRNRETGSRQPTREVPFGR
jgi:hypothetical protein